MATWRRSRTTLPLVVAEAEHFAAELRRQAITVTRVKVEAAPYNEDIPVLDGDAANHDAANYFEHHIKLFRIAETPKEQLLQLCEAHFAHLSRNAFRQPAEGYEERFVTLRSYGVGRTTSERQLQKLLTALGELGEQVLEHESEYCVYDSNLDLDAGWLPAIDVTFTLKR